MDEDTVNLLQRFVLLLDNRIKLRLPNTEYQACLVLYFGFFWLSDHTMLNKSLMYYQYVIYKSRFDLICSILSVNSLTTDLLIVVLE